MQVSRWKTAEKEMQGTGNLWILSSWEQLGQARHCAEECHDWDNPTYNDVQIQPCHHPPNTTSPDTPQQQPFRTVEAWLKCRTSDCRCTQPGECRETPLSMTPAGRNTHTLCLGNLSLKNMPRQNELAVARFNLSFGSITCSCFSYPDTTTAMST